MARSLLLAWLATLALSVGCSRVQTEHLGLEIELKTEAQIIRLGEYPRISARLINRSHETATVALPADGSLHGLRTPTLRWTPSSEFSDCGNINSLLADQVVTLEPGEQVALDWLGFIYLGELGKHKISLEMEQQPNLVWSGVALGEHDPVAMQRIRDSRPFTARSNVIEIEVVE